MTKKCVSPEMANFPPKMAMMKISASFPPGMYATVQVAIQHVLPSEEEVYYMKTDILCRSTTLFALAWSSPDATKRLLFLLFCHVTFVVCFPVIVITDNRGYC